MEWTQGVDTILGLMTKCAQHIPRKLQGWEVVGYKLRQDTELKHYTIHEMFEEYHQPNKKLSILWCFLKS